MQGACVPLAALLDRARAAWRAGDQGETAAVCAELLARDPEHVEALALFAIVRARAGELATALALLDRATRLRPDDPALHANRGAVLRALGRIDEAIGSHRRALTLDPAHVPALLNLAIALRAAGRWDDAIAACERVLGLDPTHAEALHERATALFRAGRIAEAIASARETVARVPGSARAWTSLGTLLKADGQYHEALAAQARAVALAPNDAGVHANLGNTWLELGEADRAAGHYAAAIEHAPEDPQLRMRASLAAADAGRFEQAESHLAAAAALRPDAIEPLLRRLQWMPLVFDDVAESERWHSRFRAEVAALTERIDRAGPGALAGAWIEPPFALQFLPGNLRALKQACARMYAGAIEARDPPRNRGRPRVGFVVTRRHEATFLHGLGGLVDRMRGDFERVVLCDRSGAATVRAGLSDASVHVVPVTGTLEGVAAAARSACCDVLVHWEVGTDAVSWFLPFMRCAPLQCATWGVQVTSGIPAVDAYLSSRLVEGEDAVDQYSERLLLADTLLTWQRRRARPDLADPRPRLGVGGDRHLYVCAQQIGKLHPDLDPLLAAILRRDPAGVAVLVGDSRPAWNGRLRARLDRTLPDVAPRILVVPRQSEPDYLGLVAAADVLLDAPHFAGVNSSYDAFALGQPVVHRPSPCQRGRYTFGCYRRMGLADLAVHDAGSYVDLAVRVATEPDLRASLRARIEEARDALFEDASAVVALQEMMGRLVAQVRG